MMVILEMLSRAYEGEHAVEEYGVVEHVDHDAMKQLSVESYEFGLGLVRQRGTKDVYVGSVEEIPVGERKIIQIDDLSIGIFHHQDRWLALHNHCSHRGGPVATGELDGDVLICPWHGFEYNLLTGKLLVDPAVGLTTYPVLIQNDQVFVSVPEYFSGEVEHQELSGSDKKDEQLRLSDIPPGQMRKVMLNGESLAVYNVEGIIFATQDSCTHAGGSLSEGDLDGPMVICPIHGSCFDVTDGTVLCPPASTPLKTYQVVIDGDIIRITGVS
jgi:nitrite reductase/ring-hydroxylating ferredoxin subunit